MVTYNEIDDCDLDKRNTLLLKEREVLQKRCHQLEKLLLSICTSFKFSLFFPFKRKEIERFLIGQQNEK